jgi:TfoX/Sxy family transcriptional regulator of competence genes
MVMRLPGSTSDLTALTPQATGSNRHAAVLEQLTRIIPDMRRRSRIGGVAIYSASFVFAIVKHNLLYFKFDGALRAEFERAGLGAFRQYGGRDEAMGYYEVPIALLNDEELLRYWAEKSIAVARHYGPHTTSFPAVGVLCICVVALVELVLSSLVLGVDVPELIEDVYGIVALASPILVLVCTVLLIRAVWGLWLIVEHRTTINIGLAVLGLAGLMSCVWWSYHNFFGFLCSDCAR